MKTIQIVVGGKVVAQASVPDEVAKGLEKAAEALAKKRRDEDDWSPKKEAAWLRAWGVGI